MIQLLHGDCMELLRTLPAESLDACVTDPPYHLTAGKRGGSGHASMNLKSPQGRAAIGTGFMGRAWDGGDLAFRPELWAEVLRVLKPGAHVLAFGSTRTYHRLACAIEDAGAEIRDCIRSEQGQEAWPGWLYGCGMPKSRDIAKAIDKEGGTPGTYGEPKSLDHARWIDRGRMRGGVEGEGDAGWQRPWMADADLVEQNAREYVPGSDAAAEWSGWGTGLKPAWEPIVVARKPFRGTVAGNVQRYGTGALNIGACKVETGGRRLPEAMLDAPTDSGRWPANLLHDGSDDVLDAFAAAGLRGASAPVRGTEPSENSALNTFGKRGRVAGPFHGDTPGPKAGGRWPANVVQDGSAEVDAAFSKAPTSQTGKRSQRSRDRDVPGTAWLPGNHRSTEYTDAGSAARFFFSGKAGKADRAGSAHPTVKPVALMRYLVRLVTPPGGTVLDLFAGTGTTGAACVLEGFGAVLIEREAEYFADMTRRFAVHGEPVRASKRRQAAP